MPVGLKYPEGAYRVTGDNDITRGSGRISGNMNPSQTFLPDNNLPVLSQNKYFGSKYAEGQVVIGVDTIVSILSAQQKDEIGFKKPVLTVCNGETSTATDSNGYTRAASMKPIGTSFGHVYRRIPGRLVNWTDPSIDRGQFMCVPLFLDPFKADKCWVGAAVGGSTTSAGGATLNGIGVAYSSDARLGNSMDVRSPGTPLCSDHKGHFRKWVSGTDPDIMRIGEVFAFEEMPYSNMLAWTMINENGAPTMFDEFDVQRPYPLPSGRDLRAFLQVDKSFYGAGSDVDDTYMWPEQVADGNGIAGLTDGSRTAKTTAAPETFANQAVNSAGVHVIQLAHSPVCVSERGAVNPDASAPYPSELSIEWDSTGANTFTAGNAANIRTLREGIDYDVNRYNGIVTIKSNYGTGLAATDDYKITYNYMDSKKNGVPTNADWNGCVGLLYVVTYFNR